MSKRDYTSKGAPKSRRRMPPRNIKGTFKKSKPLFLLAAGLVLALSAALYWLTEQKAAPSSRHVRQRTSMLAIPSKPQERWSYIKALENKKIVVNQPTTRLLPLQPLPHASQQSLVPIPKKRPMGSHSSALPNRPPSPAVSAATGQRLPDQRHPRDGKSLKHHSAPPIWELQCGSFSNAEQAQSLRATLALLGIESSVTQDNGWPRVIIGPYHSRISVDNTLKRLKQAELHHCIIIPPQN